VRPPTPRQLELLKLIHDGWQAKRPPSIRELCGLMGIGSTNGVMCLVNACVAKGLLERRDMVARSFFLTSAGETALKETA